MRDPIGHGPALTAVLDTTRRDARDDRPARRRGPGPVALTLGYTPVSDFGAARRTLQARIDAVRSCLKRRKPLNVTREVEALLDGASDVLAMPEPANGPDYQERLQAAVAQYRKAQHVYYGYVLKANRLLYLAGALASVAALVLLAFVIYLAAAAIGPHLGEPSRGIFARADLSSLLILLGFAGLGSVASVVTRLERLPVDTFTWQFVAAAGAGRPVVAATFATVIYAGLRGQILNGLHQVGTPILDSTGPYWWCIMVAFLCGYSERFAPDLLGRAFGGDDATAVPAAPQHRDDGRAGRRSA